MILRRFMKHVTDQNWFAVGLDVIVVIVGIFLGLQVQEWNENRSAQQDERRVVASFISDLDNSTRGYSNVLNMMDRQITTTERVLEILESGVLRPDDIADFEEGIFRYGRLSATDAYLNSFHENNLNRVLNHDLRSLIDEYIGFMNRRNNVYRNVQTRIEQARTLTSLRASVRLTTTGERKSIYDFEQLKNDMEYHIAVSNLSSFEVMARGLVENLKVNTQFIRDTLSSYLDGEDIATVTFNPLPAPGS